MKDRIYLKNSIGEYIYEIYNVEDLKWEDNLLELSSLEFNIKSSIQTERGFIKNPVYEIIAENLLLEFRDKTYIITEIVEDIIDDKGIKYIYAFSIEYILSRRFILRYEADNRILYDPDNKRDDKGKHFGIINHIIEDTDIPKLKVYGFPKVATNKTINLNIDRKSILELLLELQDFYNCIIRVDLIEGSIIIIDANEINKDSIKVSSKNIIDKITKSLDDEDLVTRLWCLGRDGLDISDINITGLPYIDNFDYFINRDMISKDTLRHIKYIERKIEERMPEYQDTYREFLKIKRNLSNEEAGLRLHRGRLEKRYIEYDNARSDSEREKIKEEIEYDEMVIRLREDRIEQLESELTIGMQEMKDLQINIPYLYKKNEELNHFIIEEVYYTDYGKYDLDKLLEEGEEMIKKMSIPTIYIEVSSKELREELPKDFIDNLEIGDVVIIEDDLNNTEYNMRIIGKNYSEEGIVFRFKNTERIFVDKDYIINKIVKESEEVNSAVEMNKSNWNDVKELNKELENIQESYWAFRRENLN